MAKKKTFRIPRREPQNKRRFRKCRCTGCVDGPEILESTARYHEKQQNLRQLRARARLQQIDGVEKDGSQSGGDNRLEESRSRSPSPVESILEDSAEPEARDLPEEEHAFPPPLELDDEIDTEDYVNLMSGLADDSFSAKLHAFALLKVKSGMSMEIYAEMIECVRQMAIWFTDPEHGGDLENIPTSWRAHMLLLRRDVHYRPPETYYVCLDQHHYHLTKSLVGRCPVLSCGKLFSKTQVQRGQTVLGTGIVIPDEMLDPEEPESTGGHKGTVRLTPGDHLIPFYYISMKHRIKRMMRNNHVACKLLAHWRQRSHWLGKLDEHLQSTHKEPLQNETWDGKGFQKYSWFFDPTWKWLLPQLCTACKEPISSDLIQAGILPSDDEDIPMVNLPNVQLRCPHCQEDIEVKESWTTGDPRNLALQYHADGFYPSTTSQRTNLDAMSYTFLNMDKSERCHINNIFLCSFIRMTKEDKTKYKSNPRYLEAFYKPLFDEIQELFIEGMEIEYEHTEASLRDVEILPGPMRIRVMLFNQTGDYVGLQAHCALKSKGQKPCRFCLSHSKYMKTRRSTTTATCSPPVLKTCFQLPSAPTTHNTISKILACTCKPPHR